MTTDQKADLALWICAINFILALLGIVLAVVR